MTSGIPLVVICYNNHHYVDNTIVQSRRFGVNVIVIDNASPYQATQTYLEEIEDDVEVISLSKNHGHLCWQQPSIWDDLPDRFFLTDPDLQWNPKLPTDFPRRLNDLCSELGAKQIGFALDLSDRDQMFQDTDYFRGQSIFDWESKFWSLRLAHPLYELYEAPIDTTFQLFDKTIRRGRHLRIAGDFTARHLPWYRETPIAPHDLLHMYVASAGSTTSRLVLRDLARRDLLTAAIEECEHACDDEDFVSSALAVKKSFDQLA